MSIAFRIPKARNTNSEYVILIAAPQQQWYIKVTLYILGYPVLIIR